MNIGILGATFNPPHNGHVAAAQYAQQQLQLHRLLLIPNNLPPHKQLPYRTASTRQRLEMTRIMAREELPFAKVSEIEINRGGASYTIDTVEQLREDYPYSKFYLIIGTDMLMTIESWMRSEELMEICSLAVVARSENDRQDIACQAEYLRDEYEAEVVQIDCPALDISSTMIRDTTNQKELKRLVPPAVYAYIAEHKLYLNAEEDGHGLHHAPAGDGKRTSE